MNGFFYRLVASQSGTSSKRFISLISFMMLLAVIIFDVWFGGNVPDIVYYTLAGLIVSTSTMTILQPRKNNELNNIL